MSAAVALSEDDVVALRTGVAAGTPVTVWFTADAVGVPAGGSARVVAVGEPAEGDFIQVRPAGGRDTVFCSPNELTRARPPRKRAGKPAAAGKTAPDKTVPDKAAGKAAPTAGAVPAAAPERAAASQPVRAPRRAPATPASPAAEPAKVVPEPAGKPAARRAPAAPRPAAGVTVTLSASPEGEWSVEVAVGKKRTVRPTPVPPGDVAKAARSLPEVVTEAIEASLEAARQRQLERVERLRAELEAAQRALQDLDG